jgi:hypothetical protein
MPQMSPAKNIAMEFSIFFYVPGTEIPSSAG